MLAQRSALYLPTAILLAISIASLFAAGFGAGPLRESWLVGAVVAAMAATGLALWRLHREARFHRELQSSLDSSEARMAGIVESAMDPIIVVDEDQRVVKFNAAAERVFRWPRAAVIGQPLDMLLPERFRAQHHEHITRFGDTGVTSRRMGSQAILVAKRADGSEFPIEASISQHAEAGRKHFAVILRDVAERVRAESLLARSEARLRGILDSAMDAVITVDEAQRIVIFNTAAEAMFGCTQAEALGAPLAWFIPERFRAAHVGHVKRFGESGTGSRRMGVLRIVTGLRRNGEEFPIDASISQLAEDGTRFFTVILRDVTARVQGEQALRRSKEELQELGAAAHMAREQEKSRIARELHDELGQALTMLQMDVAWCKDNQPQSPGFSAKIARMEALLKTTVAATRRIASDLRPLMLDDLGLLPAVEWLVQNFKQRTGVACALHVDDPDLPVAGAHATAVFRIVQESLTNVAKHANATRADVAIDQADGEVHVRVSDDGIGFDLGDARRPNAFGLLGVRERASLLGGTVAISSAPGKGTRVDVRLPVEIEGAAP